MYTLLFIDTDKLAISETNLYEQKLQTEAELVKILTGKTIQEVLNEYDLRELLRLSAFLTFMAHI